uniref:TilS substrate-binding domain-containing protein n=1 Tax=Actinotalea sp. JY-7885 TaxID=2758576 RepID=UPI00165E88FF
LTAARRQGGDAGLDVEVLAGLAPAVRRRALRLALVASGAPAGAVAHRHVEEVDRLITDWHGQGPVALPGGGVAVRRCGRLTLVPRATGGPRSG